WAATACRWRPRYSAEPASGLKTRRKATHPQAPTGVAAMTGIGAWKQRLPQPGEALPGRSAAMPLRENRHHVLGTPLRAPFDGLARVQFGMGCFWGAERKFWSLPGVFSTAVGYAGGETPNPTYREACS